MIIESIVLYRWIKIKDHLHHHNRPNRCLLQPIFSRLLGFLILFATDPSRIIVYFHSFSSFTGVMPSFFNAFLIFSLLFLLLFLPF